MDNNSVTPGSEPPVQNNTDNSAAEPVIAEVKNDTVVVEATPVVMPTEPTATSETTQVPVDENTVLIKPPKKKFSLAAVIGFVVFGLLLIGGIGFAIWYFAIYQNPQNLAADAVSKFFTAEHVQMTGGFTFTIDDKYDDTALAYSVQFKNESKTLPNATTATLTMSEVDKNGETIDDHTISLELGSAVMSNGEIYFQVSNLMDAIEAVVTDDSVFDSEIGQAIYDIIELVDGEWWKISIPEIVDELDMGSSGKPIKDMYSCMITVANENYMSEYADFYRAHQFVEIAKNDELSHTIDRGNTYYSVTLDYEKMADFMNELPNSKYSNEITACYNEYAKKTGGQEVSPSSATKVTAAELKDGVPDELEIYLQIADFDHKLKTIAFRMPKNQDGYALDGLIGFIYEAGSVSAPNNYRPVTELIDGVMDIISAIYTSSGFGYGYDYDYDDDDYGWDYDYDDDDYSYWLNS